MVPEPVILIVAERSPDSEYQQDEVSDRGGRLAVLFLLLLARAGITLNWPIFRPAQTPEVNPQPALRGQSLSGLDTSSATAPARGPIRLFADEAISLRTSGATQVVVRTAAAG